MGEADRDRYEADDLKEYEKHLKEYERPSILWMIYAAITTLALALIGTIEVYEHLNPETPAEQLVRAVDALDSGQDLIAHRLFKKLAADGNPAAEYWLADLYEFGLGTAKNLPGAVTLLQASADKGFVPAELRLGELYLAGVDIDPDYAKARDLLGKAAAAGNAEAQRLVGQMYAAGLGQPRDPFLAAVYFSAASINRDPLAVPERDSITTQLSPDQIAQIKPEIAKLGLTK